MEYAAYILALAPVVLLVIVNIFQKYDDVRETKRNLSTTLYNEIRINRIFIFRLVQQRASLNTNYVEHLKRLQTNVYDGIVATTNIRYFTDTRQRELHKLYNNIKYQNSDCIPQLTINSVELLHMKNENKKYSQKFKNGWKMIVMSKYERMYGAAR